MPTASDFSVSQALNSPLSENGSKARYGLAYLHSICAQAGVGMNETAPDEDVLAIDCDVKFFEGNVGVQVKCTSGVTLSDSGHIRYSLKQSWIDKWERCLTPVYLVIVVVPPDLNEWLDHPTDGTMHRTAAYWKRIKTDQVSRSVYIPRSQRFTSATFTSWKNDLISCYVPSSAP